MKDNLRLSDNITNWIKDKVMEAHADGVVVGLSGGVDSSVVAALSRKALGKNRVLALILPCHSEVEDLKDAKIVAKKLGIKTKIIDLSEIYDSFIKILPKANRIVKANLKPRLRMTILYYFANKLNYLVCGTGNKTEFMIGYFTKYGDGAVDILPLGGLFKFQVKELAGTLNIPKRIVDKIPTAGLWPGQTDEGEMGISYSELDGILSRLFVRKKQVFSKEKVRRVKSLILKSQHKRECPKIPQYFL